MSILYRLFIVCPIPPLPIFQFHPGDKVSVGGIKGVVTSMGWFDTSVRKSDEATVIIPNGKILNEVNRLKSIALARPTRLVVRWLRLGSTGYDWLGQLRPSNWLAVWQHQLFSVCFDV